MHALQVEDIILRKGNVIDAECICLKGAAKEGAGAAGVEKQRIEEDGPQRRKRWKGLVDVVCVSGHKQALFTKCQQKRDMGHVLKLGVQVSRWKRADLQIRCQTGLRDTGGLCDETGNLQRLQFFLQTEQIRAMPGREEDTLCAAPLPDRSG